MIFTPPPDGALAAAYRWVQHVAGVNLTRGTHQPDVIVERGYVCADMKLPANVSCLWTMNEKAGEPTVIRFGYTVGKWETRRGLLAAAGWGDRRIHRFVEGHR